MAALASDWLRHFWLLLWNRWMVFNKTWQEVRSKRPLPRLFFFVRAYRKNKITTLATDWLRHFWLLLLNRWWEFNETWQELRSQRLIQIRCPPPPLASDWHLFLLLLWNIWMEFNKTWQEARSQRALPGLCFSDWTENQNDHHGLLFPETLWTSLKSLNRILTELDRKQDFKVL